MPDNSLYSLRSSSIRNNGGRFSTTTVAENSDSEYSDSEYNNSEYSDPELLIYELENSNEANFDNEKTELNEEEAKQLIYENSSFYDLRWDNKASGELQSRIELSFEISQQVFQRGPWMARRIREWSKSWIITGALPVYRQGQQKYTQTLIDDEDIQSSCLRYIRTIGERITAEKFQQYIQDNILPHLTSSCTSISLETARTWFRRLGLGMGKALMILEFLTETRGHLTITFTEISELNLPPTFPQEARSRLRDSWFINAQNERVTQPMIFLKNLPPDYDNYIFHDQPKGIRQVLLERNLWPTNGLRLKYENSYYDPSAPNCCARHLFQSNLAHLNISEQIWRT
ncbi:12774_t:CDS:2 [Ambispora leptoticha]|uniref:12774_t:CDS:1 n=2 Tax=Glomeromycetes TaxID=214506 RepID=A0A9N9ALS0_9GLOM|nr:12774_t:CDS:2 [Ambispora leptoticha]